VRTGSKGWGRRIELTTGPRMLAAKDKKEREGMLAAGWLGLQA